MPALEWFQSIAHERERIGETMRSLALLQSRIEPHAQAMGATGHGSGGDRMVGMAILSMKLHELERELPRMEQLHERHVEAALDVLYGRSGRGGLAKARSTTDADLLCAHYLQGIGWAEIAREMGKPDTEWPSQWCRQRAVRACWFIDRIGMEQLAET